ncbi:MAG TPA: Wzz/FepE/Etk N-terminal domain-containing protein, partial [Flavisolibacter sp.]|nr:Wzz/FepE/Etk N-terminal domain-containing protein [Flavisolibacter sp.]
MTQKKTLQADDANILNLIRFKYIPYWPLFILLLCVSIVGAWFYLRHKVPIYESTATILIKDQKKGIEDAKMLESLNQLATNKIIENEIEIIKSRSLMMQVIRNLHLYAPVFEEGSVITKSAYTTSPVLVEARAPDELDRSAKIYFTFNLKGNEVDIKGKKFLIGQWVKMPFGEIRFINNPHYRNVKNAHPLYFTVSAPKYMVGGLTGALNAYSSNKSSTVINLKYQDESPERGQDILNELIKAYNKEAIDDKNILAANTLEFVEDRLAVVA